MADSTCLVRGFSYPSAIPNESRQGNLMLALGDSVSFGRFLNESLSWEKRSAFSQKNYVEEAEQYSRPGSVAQKKAFFEAHYRKIAAKKSADVVEHEGVEVCQNNVADEQRVVVSIAPLNARDLEMKCVDITDGKENLAVYKEHSSIVVVDQETVVVPRDDVLQEMHVKKSHEHEATEVRSVVKSLENNDSGNTSVGKNWESAGIAEKKDLEEGSVGGSAAHLDNQDVQKSATLDNFESSGAISASGGSETIEKEMLSDTVANDDRKIPSTRIEPEIWKDPSTLTEPFSLLENEQNATQGTVKDVTKSPLQSEPCFKKPCSATMKTDSLNLAYSSDIMVRTNRSSSDPATIPKLNDTGMDTARDSSSLSKSSRWRLFSAVFSTSSRERTARTSQQIHEHEENMNTSKLHKMQLRKSLKEKAGNGFRRLFSCFKDPCVHEDRGIIENRGSVSTPSTLDKTSSLRNVGVHPHQNC